MATIPKSGDDLWALAESIRAFAVRNAGQITHTPVLAHLLLLAVRDSVRRWQQGLHHRYRRVPRPDGAWRVVGDRAASRATN